MLRSLLFAPGDSDRKMQKAERSGADAVILDLEDSVAEAEKPAARARVADHLARTRGQDRPARLFVRPNPLATEAALEDLVAVMAGAPDGIVLPKATPDDVRRLGAVLEALEVQNGLARGCTPILPVATETPGALFALGDYRDAGPRLAGLTWGAEDLGAAVGAISNRDEDGADWTDPYRLVRSLCLFAASAAGVAAVDTLHADFRDEAGLERSARQARRDGFTGKLAIHPAQVAVINAAFTPSPEEVDHARRVVELFAAHPAAGALSLDGRMLDRPHLIAAQKLLARAARTSGDPA